MIYRLLNLRVNFNAFHGILRHDLAFTHPCKKCAEVPPLIIQRCIAVAPFNAIKPALYIHTGDPGKRLWAVIDKPPHRIIILSYGLIRQLWGFFEHKQLHDIIIGIIHGGDLRLWGLHFYLGQFIGEYHSKQIQFLTVQMIAHFQHNIVLQFFFFVHHIRNPPQIPCLGITNVV